MKNRDWPNNISIKSEEIPGAISGVVRYRKDDYDIGITGADRQYYRDNQRRKEKYKKEQMELLQEAIFLLGEKIDDLSRKVSVVAQQVLGEKKGEKNKGNVVTKQIDFKRREFLKTAGKIIGGVVVGGAVAQFVNDIGVEEGWFNTKKNDGSLSDWELGQGLKGVNSGDIEKGEKFDVEEHQGKQEEIIRQKKEVNYRSLKKMLIIQYLTTGQVDILSIKEAIKKYWFQQYDKKGAQHYGLMKALSRMKNWHNEAQLIFSNVFRQKGLECPDWLIYLGIAESHWETGESKKATSFAGAGGVFQLMPALARHYGLRIDRSIGLDERYEVLKNSLVAAEYLSDLYLRVVSKMKIKNRASKQDWEDDSWKLTLALYNGGYVNKFFRWVGEHNEEITYNLYLQFREDRLKRFIDDKLRQKPIIYRVKAGDTLYKIARRYKKNGLSVEKIKKDNGLTGSIIRKGQILELMLPPLAQDRKKKKLEKMFSFKGELFSALENLNYPEKFIGILEVLRENNLFIKSSDDRVEYPMSDINSRVVFLGGTSKKRVR